MIHPVANVLTSVLFVAVLAALAAWAGKHQPQWHSADGRRFIAHACPTLDETGRQGRWTRVHGVVGPDSVSLRQSFLAAQRLSGTFVVVARHEASNPRHVVYELQGPSPVHLRVGVSSATAALLDALVGA